MSTASAAPARRVAVPAGARPGPVVEELTEALRGGVGGAAGWEAQVSDPAYALGVLRAQQGRNVAGVVEDVLGLRLMVWGEIAARPDWSGEVEQLLLLHEQLCHMVDVAVRCAVDAFVDESTRVLAQLATRDGLTGLLNRAGFAQALDDRLQTAVACSPAAVALLDLDGFKAINDTLGHSAGDDLLQAVAAVLDATTPTDASAARLGGDEFALLLPDGRGELVSSVLGRVLAGLRGNRLLNRPQVPVRASIGVAVAAERVTTAEMLEQADAAMYAAKRAGGDRWHLAGGAPRPRVPDEPHLQDRRRHR